MAGDNPNYKSFASFSNDSLGYLKCNFDENDFIYCDCPYSLGVGVYQDGKRGFNGWSKNDDKQLFIINLL